MDDFLRTRKPIIIQEEKKNSEKKYEKIVIAPMNTNLSDWGSILNDRKKV